jgi:hypothetical protein
MNQAVQLGGEGARWRRTVLWSVLGALAGVILLLVFLFWSANRTRVDPRVMAIETRNLLSCYRNAVQDLTGLPAGTAPTTQQVRTALTAVLHKEIQEQQKIIEIQNKVRGVADQGTRERVALLKKALEFKDGYRRDFVIEVKSADEAVIRSTSPEIGDPGSASVTLSLRPAKSAGGPQAP